MYLGFLWGNALKYVTRMWHKHDTPNEDINKAIVYLKKLKEEMDNGNDNKGTKVQ